MLVNWWAYTWGAYIRRGLIFGGGLYSEVYGITTHFLSCFNLNFKSQDDYFGFMVRLDMVLSSSMIRASHQSSESCGFKKTAYFTIRIPGLSCSKAD